MLKKIFLRLSTSIFPSSKFAVKFSSTKDPVLEAIASRRSVRWFEKDKQVPLETIQKILKAVSNYPSAHNRQPVRAIICQNQDLLRELGSAIEERGKDKFPFLVQIKKELRKIDFLLSFDYA